MDSTLTPVSSPARPVLDVDRVRRDFPILSTLAHGKPLVYLDNAATTQKPRVVIDALSDYYLHTNANVHRGVHYLSQKATDAYEGARERVARFIHAAQAREIVFVRGGTEAINLVSHSWGRANLEPGDEVLITTMEHHSNIVPWQLLVKDTGCVLKVVPITPQGELDMGSFASLLSTRTKLVSCVHQSNSLGTINPVSDIICQAHAVGAKVLIDGAQAISHHPVDVQLLDCDFYTFSGHKLYGPMGIGVLYAKAALLEAMPPYQGGGDMIKSVTFEHTEYHEPPYRFEAGTPNVGDAIALAVAMDYLELLGWPAIEAHERDLLDYGTTLLSGIKGLRMIGTAAHKASILSFILEGVHPLDAGTILDRRGIAVRTGHHCTQPVMDYFHIPATIRASLACYNTRAELEQLASSLEHVRKLLS